MAIMTFKKNLVSLRAVFKTDLIEYVAPPVQLKGFVKKVIMGAIP